MGRGLAWVRADAHCPRNAHLVARARDDLRLCRGGDWRLCADRRCGVDQASPGRRRSSGDSQRSMGDRARPVCVAVSRVVGACDRRRPRVRRAALRADEPRGDQRAQPAQLQSARDPRPAAVDQRVLLRRSFGQRGLDHDSPLRWPLVGRYAHQLDRRPRHSRVHSKLVEAAACPAPARPRNAPARVRSLRPPHDVPHGRVRDPSSTRSPLSMDRRGWTTDQHPPVHPPDSLAGDPHRQ